MSSSPLTSAEAGLWDGMERTPRATMRTDAARSATRFMVWTSRPSSPASRSARARMAAVSGSGQGSRASTESLSEIRR